MTGLELIQQYDALKVAARKEVQRLQFAIDDVNNALQDSKPDLRDHVEAQRQLVQQKYESFWQSLHDTVMSEDFTRQWQMRAIVALSNVLPHAQSAIPVVSTQDGAAAIAYCLTGALSRAAIDAIMPGRFVNGLQLSATNDEHLKYRRAEIVQMCETLGICSSELAELSKEESLLNTLTDFRG